MYYLQTTSPGQAIDEALKYEASHRKAQDAFRHCCGPPGFHKRRHEDIASVDLRAKPWMKNFAFSSRDLIWGTCTPREEEFMSLSQGISSPVPLSLRPSEPFDETSVAFLSLFEGPTISSVSADSCQQDYPRFRQDLIMDREDVDQKMLELQTTLQRSTSSESLPSPFSREAHMIHSNYCVDAGGKSACRRISDSTTSPSSNQAKNCGYKTDDASFDQSGTLATARAAPGAKCYSSQSSRSPDSAHSLYDMSSKVQIHHEEERVYAAMDEGTASVLQCMGCSRFMLATSDNKLVYCPGCGTLSPFEIGLFSSAATFDGASVKE